MGMNPGAERVVDNGTPSESDSLRTYARRLVALEGLHESRVRTHDGFTERWCIECRQDWPCPTLRFVKGEFDER